MRNRGVLPGPTSGTRGHIEGGEPCADAGASDPIAQEGGSLGRLPAWPAFLLAAIGVALVTLAQPLTSAASRVLPAAAEVRSKCCDFPWFGEAYPPMLRSLGGALVVSSVTWLLAAYLLRRRPRPIGGTLGPNVALAVLVVGVFGVYAWLSYPHNASSVDASIHWVSIFFRRRGDFFYTLVKPLHFALYDFPHIAQGLLGVANLLLMVGIVRRLTSGRWIPLLAGASFVSFGTLLMRADGATDVLLNVAALLAVVLLYLQRSRFGVGASLFLVTLARPPWVLFLIAFVAVEMLFPGDEHVEGRPWIRAIRANRFLWENVASFTILFLAWHGALALTGMGWLGTGGQLVESRPVFTRHPRPIDGFTISRLSGAYFLHALWVVPIPVIAASAYVWVRLKALARQPRKAFVFVWFFIVMALTLHEVLVFGGYTVKYLSYLVPLFIVVAWFALRVPRPTRAGAAVAALTVLLALAPATAYQNAFSARNERAATTISELFAPRTFLRRAASERLIATTLSGRANLKYMGYVFKVDALREGGVIVVAQGEMIPNAFVVTDSLEGYEQLPILWHGEKLYVVGPTPGLTG